MSDHEKYVFMALKDSMSSICLSSLRRQSDVGQANGGTNKVSPYPRFILYANENKRRIFLEEIAIIWYIFFIIIIYRYLARSSSIRQALENGMKLESIYFNLF